MDPKRQADIAARAMATDPFYAWLFPRRGEALTRAVMRLALRRATVRCEDGALVSAWLLSGELPSVTRRRLRARLRLA